ncbi:NEDD4 family-interacting protein 1-like [Anabarilius grahami]|uniref:NEDD4 family-interacting protein 1-like n=1 Tax=Anabarilius grahami TaxID=495550 RepID=A0A3N0XUK7_ANAGA|nr:NEDD4 family-interacting protein 1-like [Anabarilius grahami]
MNCLLCPQLPNEEDPEEGPQLASDAPPPYSSIAADSAVAFLFNWIGFFLSFCLTTSAAGRYGAISGFGLSLIKWILIVRFSTYFPGYFDGQYWLWWVFLLLGFLLFLRGFINYAKIRKMADSFSTLPRTRVLFI